MHLGREDDRDCLLCGVHPGLIRMNPAPCVNASAIALYRLLASLVCGLICGESVYCRTILHWVKLRPCSGSHASPHSCSCSSETLIAGGALLPAHFAWRLRLRRGAADRFPLSPRVRRRQAILDNLEPPAPRPELPPLKPPGEPSMLLAKEAGAAMRRTPSYGPSTSLWWRWCLRNGRVRILRVLERAAGENGFYRSIFSENFDASARGDSVSQGSCQALAGSGEHAHAAFRSAPNGGARDGRAS
jgi:hypothetical protein